MKAIAYILSASIFLLIGLSGCKQKRDSAISEDGVDIISVDLEKLISSTDAPYIPGPVSKISIKEKVDKLELIPLETNEECLISEISKVLIYNNTYIISDERLGKILQFDDKGKFLRSFGSKGRGPLEFPRIWDIEIDPKNGELGVLCISNPLTIKYFSISNDSAYSKTYEHTMGYHFIYLDENTLLFYDSATEYENGYTLMVADRSGQTKANYFPNPHKVGHYTTPNRSFHAYGEFITFIRENHNVVYQITKDTHTLSERYIIDFGKYNLPESIRDLFYTNFQEYQLSSENYVSGIDNVLETDAYVYFDFEFGNQSNGVFYSKKNKTMDYGSYTDNWLDGILVNPVATIGNDFLSVLESSRIFQIADHVEDKSSQAWIDFLEENPSYQELYSNLNELSNPVLVRYKLAQEK